MFVEKLENFTGDLAVVNAARVSHNKWHAEFDTEKDGKLLGYLAAHKHWTPFAHPQFAFLRQMPITHYIKWATESGPGFVRKIIYFNNESVAFIERGSLYAYIRTMDRVEPLVQRALWRRCPFSLGAHGLVMRDEIPEKVAEQDLTDCLHEEDKLVHALTRIGIQPHPPLLAVLGVASFRMKMPIAIAREWFRHTVDLTRNEVSRRYVRPPHEQAEFYLPTAWRKGSKNIKQGSLSEVVEAHEKVQEAALDVLGVADELYNKMVVEWKVAPEQARFVLPQSMLTSFIETGSLDAYKRIYSLRSSHDAQVEIQQYAQDMRAALAPLWPAGWGA